MSILIILVLITNIYTYPYILLYRYISINYIIFLFIVLTIGCVCMLTNLYKLLKYVHNSYYYNNFKGSINVIYITNRYLCSIMTLRHNPIYNRSIRFFSFLFVARR